MRSLKARAGLKAAGLGISFDLTSRQRQHLQAFIGANMFGYFKDGKLVTASRSSTINGSANIRETRRNDQTRKLQTMTKSSQP